MRKTCCASHRRRAGTVLFLVTIVIGLVTLAAVGFTMSMRSENMAAHLQADQSQVEQVGASAIAFIGELASMSRQERDDWGGLDQNPKLFQDIRVDWDLQGERHGRFCILAPTYQSASSIPRFEFGIRSTSSKVSLRTLMRWERREPGAGREALMMLPSMTPELADSILDWLDEDDEKREFGEETEFYRQKDPPRNALNSIPQHIGEIRQVRGVNPLVLLGHQDGIFHVANDSFASSGIDRGSSIENRPSNNTTLPSAGAQNSTVASAGQENVSQVEAPPWSHYLTTRSAQRNESYDGRPRIWLNDSNSRRLYSQLQASFDSRTAGFVMAWRKFGPSESDAADAVNRTPPPTALRGELEFEIESVFDLVDAVVGVPKQGGDGELDYFRSPFSSNDAASLASLVPFADQTTTRPRRHMYGRIDIMTASQLALQMIPGFDEDAVERLIDARNEPPTEGASRVHIAWLLADDLLDVDTLRLIEPFITVGGDIFEAQVVAMYDARSPWFRAEVMIDGTRQTEQPLYYRDLRRLGRGFDFANLVPALPTSTSNNASLPNQPAATGQTGQGFQVPPVQNSSSLTSGR